MAIDPIIKQKADDIRHKIYGKEVRESLASGLESMSEDVEATISRQDYVEEQFQNVIDETTDKDVISAPELIAARNGELNLKTRLDKEHQEVTAQLAQIDPYLLKNTVNVKSLGVVGDGTDETVVFKSAIEYVADNHLMLYIPNDMTIHIDVISIRDKSNFGIWCDGLIKRLDNAPTTGAMLNIVNSHNINIPVIHFDGNALNNGCIEDIAYTAAEEQNHTLNFTNCSNVDIGTLDVYNPSGDGIYLAGGSKYFYIKNVIGRADKKIGRNIVSIISATNIYIDNIDSINVGHFDMPGGFDIEPNKSTEVVEDIYVNNVSIVSAGTNVLSVLNTNDAVVRNVFINNANIVSNHTFNNTVRNAAYLCGENVTVNNLVVEGNDNAHLLIINNLGVTTDGIHANNFIGNNGVRGMDLGFGGTVKNVFVKAKIRDLSLEGVRLIDTNNIVLDIDISNVGESSGVIVSSPNTESINQNITITGDISKRGNGVVAVSASAQPKEKHVNWSFNNLDFTGWGNDARIRGSNLTDVTKHNCPNLTHMTSRPNFEVWKKGDIIYNSNPVILGDVESQYIIDKWIAKEDGSGGNIWIESKIYTGT